MSQDIPLDPTHVPGDADPDFPLPENPDRPEMPATIPPVPAPAV